MQQVTIILLPPKISAGCEVLTTFVVLE